LGFAVREAENGLEAIALWQDWHPELILMDIVMPAMDGHEATRRIRAMPAGDAVKIVALSASAFDEDRDAVMATGADDFVRKPVTADDLLTTIGRHLELVYDYAEPGEGGEAVRLGRPPEVARLAVVPRRVLEALRRAALRGDDQEIMALIEGLPPDQAELAAVLRPLVARYDWDAVETTLGTLRTSMM